MPEVYNALGTGCSTDISGGYRFIYMGFLGKAGQSQERGTQGVTWYNLMSRKSLREMKRNNRLGSNNRFNMVSDNN